MAQLSMILTKQISKGITTKARELLLKANNYIKDINEKHAHVDSLDEESVNNLPFISRFQHRIRKQFNEQKGNSLNLVIKCDDGDVLCSDDVLFSASAKTESLLEFIKEVGHDSQMFLKVPFLSTDIKDLLAFYYEYDFDNGIFIYEKYFNENHIKSGQAIRYLDIALYFGFNDILKEVDPSCTEPFTVFTVQGVVNYSAFIERFSNTGFSCRKDLTNGHDRKIYEFIRDNLQDQRILNLFNRPFFIANFPGTLYLLDTLLKSGKTFEDIMANEAFQKRKLTYSECLCVDFPESGNIFPQINELKEALKETYAQFSKIIDYLAQNSKIDEKDRRLSIFSV